MKRFLSYLLITVMMLGVLAGCETTPKQVEEYTFPDAEYAVNATDMAVVGDKIYYISDEKVYETASDAVVFEEFPVSRIAAAGETFAVFGGGQVKIGEDSYTLPVPEITSLVCVGNTIGYTYKENDLEMLGFVNRKNGDSISITPLESGQVRMLPYKDKSVLVHCINTESGYILLYDFDTETMKPGSVMVDSMSMDLPAYNQKENAIYWLDGNAGGSHLTRYDVETGETTTLIPADALRMSILDLTFSGGSAIVRKLSGGISVVNEYIATEEGIATVNMLTLYGSDYSLDELAYILKRDHNIQLNLTTIKEDKLKLKLLAGESDFDLYFGAMQDGADHLTNTLILDHPVWEPLENFPQIMEQMDALFDDVVRLCTYDGHIFGIPKSFSISNTFLSYDAALFEELGVTLPDTDWTLEDFYKLAKEVRSDGIYLAFSPPLSLWDYMHQYFDPYGSGTLNDDGPVLREYLTIYKKLCDEDLIYPGTAKEMREEVANGELRILLGNATSGYIWDRQDVLLPPSFNGERIYTVNRPYLIMNPNSKNKNAAATVIAEYLNPENRMMTDSNRGGYIYKDMSVYTHSIVYYANHEESWDNADEERREEMLQEIEERRAEYTTNDLVNMDEKTAHNFELYLDVLKYAKLGPSYVDEWLRFAGDEQSKYLNDQQDLDYTVQRIIDRAKLILDE